MEFLPKRRRTRPVSVGSVQVGGDAPISVQSMTTTDTRDISATIHQIRDLARAGCEIVRLAVNTEGAARALPRIKEVSPVPLIADIHFDHTLALLSIEGGVDGLRINPGNIGSQRKVREVVHAAMDRNVPIRIGVNAGSLERDLLAKYGRTPQAMVESALGHIRLLEKEGFDKIKVSLKASDVPRTVLAYRLLAQRVDYPFHIGITEAGTLFSGTIRSAIGLGILLAEGIGDTLRVSLSADPVEEIKVAYTILRDLGIRKQGVEIIACPTCGRAEIDVIPLAARIERRLLGVKSFLKVAVMGCVVNGPGEAKEADVGVAGGKQVGLLFRKGKIIRRLKPDNLEEPLIEEVRALTGETIP
ncbi:MAG: 4-hydroxy-3-methylbut-2-en-1-yl diphosphate synthase [Deltaproteobacteria bacterium]|nr:MAG: 4-hydroxy-3-methylbut-2-en-1-yl diphosphate synthase [Deltaproteobacteria bacterium]